MENIKALVVDDTIVYRKIVGDVLKEIPGVEVVGSANNGKIALSKIRSLQPDLITLDIEMPELNGIEVLQELKKLPKPPIVIMLSTLTQQGSEMTIKALELGAFDFIAKPDDGKMADNMQKVKDAILPIINILKRRKETSLKIRNKAVTANKKPAQFSETAPKDTPPHQPVHPKNAIRAKAEVIGIGISTGGPNALTKMIPMLPADLKATVLIVQHMPPLFTASLANSLNNKSALEVKEAQDGDIIEPGKILIAPGGKQMKIVAAADGITRKIKITDDPPENSCKPSADYLFRSIAQHYVGRSTGVIMTGMGSDGSKGLVQMKNNGSFIIAQNEETCTVYGMPKEPVESGIADIVVPLESIADEIIKTVIS
ncbi:MAG: chemotaxis response regulator protein-glutamate methylesterase [Proteobacteria bacterium]|nr:chemotaxis response regulator protein-glutamate methylesterase [Pseudomonadota bacterium]MBU1387910.1 chemotaxis response regulator protein-glutamate methylesterase [Pseudomonadota bacterium]MBU1541973.1 chemotaxis response regulator protein-glutamate methylesterase [Pseudomonadota bacterium]MBU2481337.1 chemotaxis response regulator protein-glutamate methylesterase [Pseudomonadota bacterium]